MADRWFYGHDELKHGPFSGQELKDLASRGEIVPTDTVWKEGVERGALASRVKNLFAPAVIAAVVEPVVAARVVEPACAAPPEPAAPVALAEPPAEKAPSAAPPPAAPPPARKGRATAGKGAIIMSQDGVNVKFKKKCTVCGNIDSAWNTMPIRSGTIRSTFYCRKCRKPRDVEVHCTVS